MKNKTFLFAASLLFALSANAGLRSYDEMQEAARGALLRQANYSRFFKIHRLEQPVREILTESHLHVYASEGAGAVVVCDDDRYEAVLGVSEAYTPGAEIPDGFRFYLQQVSRNIEAGSPAKALAPAGEVDNFVPTIWGQGKPFNIKAPKIGGFNPPAGCVAVCMSQVMYTMNYPSDRPVFKKENGDYYKLDGKEVPYSTPAPSPFFKEPTTYDWSQILPSYNDTYTAEQGQAVQRLMFDCGVAVHMNYTVEGSGATMSVVPGALAHHFCFDSLSVASPMAVFYAQDEWQELIYREMLNRAPIIYSATAADNSGGHAFLFSGLRSDGKVYVNWGWNGDYNGWFDISNLKPIDNSSTDFSANHHLVLGIRPEQLHPSGVRQEFSASLLGVEDPVVKAVNDDLQFRFSYLYNLHWRDFEGDIAILLQKEDDPEWSYLLQLMSSEDEGGEPLEYGTGWSMQKPIDFLGLFEEEQLSDMPAGTYYFGFFSYAVDDTAMQMARAYGLGRVLWRVTVGDNHRVTAVEQITDQHELDLLTSIDAPKADETHSSATTDATYNLAGQRVPRATRGLVIRNGQKFVVK